jgi:hypothetical protein
MTTSRSIVSPCIVVAEVRKECFPTGEHAAVNAVAHPRPAHLAVHEACRLKHLEMLGDGRGRERQHLGDRPVHATISPGEQPNDPRPHGMAEGLGEAGELRINAWGGSRWATH